MVELNTVDAVENAADKLRMKQCFDKHKVATAPWFTHDQASKIKKFPIVAKHRFGSRGTGVYKLASKAELDAFIQKHPNQENYIYEKFKPYNREYRLHVNDEGCFYTCRKARRRGVAEDQKWKFNYEHTVWLREDNENFRKP